MLLLQLLRGGEELVAVRSVGCHVAEDDALVVRTAQRAEDSWRRQRAAEREAAAAAAAGRQSLNGGTEVPIGNGIGVRVVVQYQHRWMIMRTHR